MRFKIKRGLDIPLSGAPSDRIDDGPRVSRVALVGYDYMGAKRLPTLEVQPGERVRLGQPLVRAKGQEGVVGTAPGTGVVEAVHRGARRALETIVVRLDGTDDAETFNAYRRDQLAGLNRDQVRSNLLASGAWLSLRTRPFSMIPDPQRVPDALFVNAMDTNPLAADPAPIIDDARDDFVDGLTVVSKLTDGNLYVCHRSGADIPLPTGAAFKACEFEGPHPAGLVGTHIHFVRPVSAQREVWHLDYQDAIAIGRLFKTGIIHPERIVSLAGPMVEIPRLIRTRVGADTNALVAHEIKGAGDVRVISGSVLSGRHAVGNSAYLGHFHRQITVLAEGREREFFGWLSPGVDKYSALGVFVSSLLGARRFDLTTTRNGSPRAMVPIGAYERVMPLDVLPTQLLRSLVVDDTETAVALGALELDEEDLALCSFVDCGKHDFGPILRRNLTAIRQEMQ